MTVLPTDPGFDGQTFNHARDHERLTGQLWDIYAIMKDQCWHTLGELAEATGEPEPSISARLRDLRKDRFGKHTIERRYKGNGLHEYRLAAGPGLGKNAQSIALPRESAQQDLGALTPAQAKEIKNNGISPALRKFYETQERYGHGHHVTRLDRLKKCKDPDLCDMCQREISHIYYLKKKAKINQGEKP